MNKITMEGNVHKEKASFVYGTNDREACPRRWIAVLVQVNCEKRTATLLGKAGYENYVPIQQEEVWLRDQSYIHKLLALPGTDEDKKGFATTIPDCQIERLKFLLENAETEVTIVSNFRVGDSVRVTSGPLNGLEGVVSEADEKSSIVGIQIDGLGYACVKIAKNYLTC